MRESVVQQKTRATLNHPKAPTRVWRNNVGGTKIKGKWVSWGLAKGSADLIGIHRRLITPDMVGQYIGQFLSVEVKNSEGGVVAEDQEIWRDTINKFGGNAVIWKSPEEARRFLEEIFNG